MAVAVPKTVSATVAEHGVYPQVYVDLAGIDWLLPRKEFHRYLRGSGGGWAG